MGKQQPTPGFKISALTFGSILTVISVGLFWLHINLQSLLLICLLIASFSAWRLTRQGFQPIRNAMNHGVRRALTAIYIFLLIGILIASFIQSGTVGTLIYYGLEFISPATFLPSGLILCSLMSLATGSSWSTAGTAGIILVVMGHAMGIPVPIVAGMVVSGACFGDKMSPVSDTTNLAAMSSEVPLYRHIKSMMYTTLPTYMIVLVIFSIIGAGYAEHPLPLDHVQKMSDALSSSYKIGIICLLPLVIMLTLNMLKVSAEPAMMTATISAVLLGIFYQDQSLGTVMNALLKGHAPDTGIASLDKLLGSGGILAMMPTLSITLLTLTLGGILHQFGFLHVLMSTVLKKIKSVGPMVTTTIISCLVGNISMGEAYMSIILGGQLFRESYNKLSISRSVLSRSLEEGATLTTVLVPWATGGLFFSATLNVPVTSYAPWALLNWMNPLISILFAFLGIAIWKSGATDKEQSITEESGPDDLSISTSKSIDPLAQTRNLPPSLIREFPKMIINHKGSSPEAFMVTEDFAGHIIPGKHYRLEKQGFKEVNTEITEPDYSITMPENIRVNLQGAARLNTGHNHFYLDTAENQMNIPVEDASPEKLAFYGCRHIPGKGLVRFDSNHTLPVTIIHTGKRYAEDYLFNPKYGKGVLLESHDNPYFIMPLSEKEDSYLLLGKKDADKTCVLTAFKTPKNSGIYIPPASIFSTAYMTGRHLVVYPFAENASRFFIPGTNDRPFKITFSQHTKKAV